MTWMARRSVDRPGVEKDARFPRQVNAGFMQVLSRGEIKLRVYERGAARRSPAAPVRVPRRRRHPWLARSAGRGAYRGGSLLIEWPTTKPAR